MVSTNVYPNMLEFFRNLFIPRKTVYGFPENAVFIDVSSAHQFEKAHLKGAINVPLEILYNITEILCKYNTQVVVVCNNGFRSQIAFEILYKLGVNVHYGGNWRKLKFKQ
jgi:rhodanese-related sulfurtransferase